MLDKERMLRILFNKQNKTEALLNGQGSILLAVAISYQMLIEYEGFVLMKTYENKSLSRCFV